jgi:plasmid maintenance system antidote protein VapI
MLREDFMPDYGLRLSRLFGNWPEFRFNEQRAVDLWEAAQNSMHERATRFCETAIGTATVWSLTGRRIDDGLGWRKV